MDVWIDGMYIPNIMRLSTGFIMKPDTLDAPLKAPLDLTIAAQIMQNLCGSDCKLILLSPSFCNLLIQVTAKTSQTEMSMLCSYYENESVEYKRKGLELTPELW